jgi:hypothetical protein
MIQMWTKQKVYTLDKEQWESIQFKCRVYNGKKINNNPSNIKIGYQDSFGTLQKMNKKTI